MLAKLKRVNYHTKYFCGGGIVTQLIFKGDKIVMLIILRKYSVNWYHAYILHPRIDCTEASIIQNYYWPQLRDGMHTQVKVCRNFQRNSKQGLKYDYLPAKEVEDIP